MQVNSEFIKLGMANSTLNRAQCELLGLVYPLNEALESLKIEKELSLKETNLFLFLRGNLALKAQEQIIKNYELVAEFHKKPKEQKETPTITTTDMIIYCDGACKGNPGKAGSGLAIYQGEQNPILLYGEYEEHGTNNTAELNALYKALVLASESVESTIYSDSKYSIDCISTWAYGWKKNGWRKKGGEIKNLETIKLAHELYERIKNKVTLKHVKGHSGVEGNELADRMAVYAIVSKSREYQTYDYKRIDDVLRMNEG